jgi:hypothetical protein
VLEQLAELDLYALSFLCRRLHVIALPLFLKKKKIYISDGVVTVSASHSHANFKVIRSALFIHTLNLFDCLVFPNSNIRTRHLERLICRMANVSVVYFRLYSSGPDISPSNPLPILFKALENKSCHTMSISGAPIAGFVDRPETNLPPITTLARCRISNPVLFMTSWLQWTVKSLNSSPLTHLEIGDCNLSNVLPLLTLPSLSQLALVNVKPLMSDLAPFLSRHPNIHTLSLHSLQHNILITGRPFHKLTTLHGTTSCLKGLFARPIGKSKRGPTQLEQFSCLQAIHVTDLMNRKITQINAFVKAFGCTPASYLSTHFFVSTRFTSWLRSSPGGWTRITTIHLSHVPDLCRLLADFHYWMPVFTNLNTLEIETASRYVSCWEGKVRIVEELMAEHPRIQIVKCDGFGGTLQDWRSGKDDRDTAPSENNQANEWALKFL